jgi:hypothetical protein
MIDMSPLNPPSPSYIRWRSPINVVSRDSRHFGSSETFHNSRAVSAYNADPRLWLYVAVSPGGLIHVHVEVRRRPR